MLEVGWGDGEVLDDVMVDFLGFGWYCDRREVCASLKRPRIRMVRIVRKYPKARTLLGPEVLGPNGLMVGCLQVRCWVRQLTTS